jgi:hypothetical protein
MVFESEIFTTTCCACKLNTQYPFSIFRLADAALIAAGTSGKNETPEAGAAFLRVQEAMRNLAPLLLEKIWTLQAIIGKSLPIRALR